MHLRPLTALGCVIAASAAGGGVAESAMPRTAFRNATRIVIQCSADLGGVCSEILAEVSRGSPVPVARLSENDRLGRADMVLLAESAAAAGRAGVRLRVTSAADPDEAGSAPARAWPLPADAAARGQILAQALDRLLPWRAEHGSRRAPGTDMISRRN